MKKIDNFINMYSVSKTLRFRLIPQGKTGVYFSERNILSKDKSLGRSYEIAKKAIDRYHKAYIDKVLQDVIISHQDILEYANLYEKSNRNDAENVRFDEIKQKLRQFISNKLTSNEEYVLLSKKDIIQDLLPKFDINEQEREAIKELSNFTTFFQGFYDNRKNLYGYEGKSTEISYRLIDQNLPKFISNIKTGKMLVNILPEEIQKLKIVYQNTFGIDILNIFEYDYFNNVLTQRGIDIYNQIIGGYTTQQGEKVQGLNEIINLYNQKNNNKLPKLIVLFKQILSDRSTISFLPEKIQEGDICKAITDFCYGEENEISREYAIRNMLDMLACMNILYDVEKIYVSSKYISTLSNDIFGYWGAIREEMYRQYDSNQSEKSKQNIEAYTEKRDNYFKRKKYVSIGELKSLIDNIANRGDVSLQKDLYQAIRDQVDQLKGDLQVALTQYEALTRNGNDIQIKSNEQNISIIKDILDAIKSIQEFAKLFLVDEDIEGDMLFYSDYSAYYQIIVGIIPLYNKIRNCITEKPYSNEKIKVNFDNPQFLNGWDMSKESDYLSIFMKKDDNYYLVVLDKDNKKVFDRDFEHSDDVYQKMNYKLLPGPNKMLPKVIFSNKNSSIFHPSKEILDLYSRQSFKKGANFNIDDCHKLIDYYKWCFTQYDSWKIFDFKLKDTSEYEDIAQFYKDVAEQGYKISFRDIPASYIDQLVDEGKLYLFKIYSKDFSSYSKGTPNLHTMYFREIFSEDNLSNTSIKLQGGAEMFYRPASLTKGKPTHPKNQPIYNKNYGNTTTNTKETSTFDYDITKDKRYTEDQFMIHMAVSLNAKARGIERINNMVRQSLRDCNSNYIIGIDRGERNLLSVSVIDSQGNIVEQRSCNIVNSGSVSVDYQKKLGEREEERIKARQEWQSINDIKNLKEGYLSLIVHNICQLVEKYDAIVVMEDLNCGFKNSRAKFEKNVYQQFEKMLIDKFNYLVDKNKQPGLNGSITKGYQLAEKFESFGKMNRQNGFIFYIPAWNTSKIDPVTGFVDLLKPRYESIRQSIDFIGKFDSIRYNSTEGYFEFAFDYSNFPNGEQSFVKNWTICTYGDRILTYRDTSSGYYNTKTIDITLGIKELLTKYGIDYANNQNLKASILQHEDKDFLSSLLRYISLTLQMRNSSNTEDYIISPIKRNGVFYDSRNYIGDYAQLPTDADANGAYNIARKGLWAIDNIRNATDEEYSKAKISISNREWLEYVQK